MGLQKQVNIDMAVAVPGQKATPDQAVYTPINYVADEAGVSMGTFCWESATAGVATATTSGSAAPLGFVERVVSFALASDKDASLVVPQYGALTVAVKGDYYVETTEAATVGGAVYVDKTNGKILAAAGTSGIDTGWKFKTAGAANDIVIISNWA